MLEFCIKIADLKALAYMIEVAPTMCPFGVVLDCVKNWDVESVTAIDAKVFLPNIIYSI